MSFLHILKKEQTLLRCLFIIRKFSCRRNTPIMGNYMPGISDDMPFDEKGNNQTKTENPPENEHAEAGEDGSESYGICPECGSELKLIATRRGLMLGCSGFPKCRYMTPFVVKQVVTVERVLENTRCPECGYPMAVKSGRYGQFISCSNYPECHYVYKDRMADEIPCPECGSGVLQVRKTKFNKVFWGCSNYPECRFNLAHQPIRRKCQVCGSEVHVIRKMRTGRKYVCAVCGNRCKAEE